MLKDVLTNDPDFIEALLNLGTIYCETNRPKNAIELYLRATEIQPDNGTTWYYLSIAYGDSKNYLQAISASLNALALQPKNQKIWMNHGYLLKQTGIEITPKIFDTIKTKIAKKREELGLSAVKID